MTILIICAGDSKNSDKLKEYAQNSDYIICADGGYKYAKSMSIIPDILVGDFDSLDISADNIPTVKLPCEKDETDALYALNMAFQKNPDEVIIYGAIGDRFDHSYANICLLERALEKNIKAVVTDGKTACYMTDSTIKLTGEKGSIISVFSYSDISYNVNIKGLKYTLCNYDLKKSDIIGVSNEFTGEEAEIYVEKGKLIIICN